MIQQLEAQCFEEHTGIFVLLTHRGFKIWEYLDETIKNISLSAINNQGTNNSKKVLKTSNVIYIMIYIPS